MQFPRRICLLSNLSQNRFPSPWHQAVLLITQLKSFLLLLEAISPPGFWGKAEVWWQGLQVHRRGCRRVGGWSNGTGQEGAAQDHARAAAGGRAFLFWRHCPFPRWARRSSASLAFGRQQPSLVRAPSMSWCEPLVGYVICKYLLPSCEWSFHFLDGVLWSAKVFNFDRERQRKRQLTFSGETA